jgi:hypothetical protein
LLFDLEHLDDELPLLGHSRCSLANSAAVGPGGAASLVLSLLPPPKPSNGVWAGRIGHTIPIRKRPESPKFREKSRAMFPAAFMSDLVALST